MRSRGNKQEQDSYGVSIVALNDLDCTPSGLAWGRKGSGAVRRGGDIGRGTGRAAAGGDRDDFVNQSAASAAMG
jgi:hypothetical protein